MEKDWDICLLKMEMINKGGIMMTRGNKITALLCALALLAGSIGAYAENASAESKMVTPDNGAFSRKMMKKGTAKSTKTETHVQPLVSGKKVQGQLLPENTGQEYQITLKSSGQLDIRLKGDAGKLATLLKDKNGKGWAPRRTANGKQTYQLKKGTYYYQVQAAKGAQIPETGLDYAVTATFKSARARFEDNTTRGKAAKPLLGKTFYGHLAQNAPVEYYEITLDRVSHLVFYISEEDDRPEACEVTLYNKQGKVLSSWWKYKDLLDEDGDYSGNDGNESSWDEYDGMGDEYSPDPGLNEVLPAGDYYVGVSIKKDKNGKVPASAWYGKYRVNVRVSGLGMSFELTRKQAEYTGKKIKPPKVVRKLYPKDACYEEEPYGINDSSIKRISGEFWHMTTDNWKYFSPPLSSERTYCIKEIGRYRIGDSGQHSYYVSPDATYAYAIFTVTPIRGKISRASSKKPGEVQISIKKNAQSTGYQIQIARDRKFRKSRKTLKTTDLKKTIKGLSHGKKYYVRIRNFKDVKTVYCPGTEVPESIYGKWSKTKTVVCK